jgi:hypothetical protein
MPLTDLQISGTEVTNLSALRGMPLTYLRMHDCPEITDLSPLADCRTLTALTLPPNAKDIEVLRTLPKLKRIGFKENSNWLPDQTAADFWREHDGQGWLRTLRESEFKPKALTRLDDGTWDLDLENAPISDLKLLSGAPITSLHLGMTGVTDLTPLRGMALKKFYLYNTKVTDLSPLNGMPIETLNLSGTEVSDLSALHGMPLKSLRLNGCSKLTDLSPLAGATTLQDTTLPEQAKDFEFLRGFPNLRLLSYRENGASWQPGQTAAEFWKEYDAKKKTETKQP